MLSVVSILRKINHVVINFDGTILHQYHPVWDTNVHDTWQYLVGTVQHYELKKQLGIYKVIIFHLECEWVDDFRFRLSILDSKWHDQALCYAKFVSDQQDQDLMSKNASFLTLTLYMLFFSEIT